MDNSERKDCGGRGVYRASSKFFLSPLGRMLKIEGFCSTMLSPEPPAPQLSLAMLHVRVHIRLTQGASNSSSTSIQKKPYHVCFTSVVPWKRVITGPKPHFRALAPLVKDLLKAYNFDGSIDWLYTLNTSSRCHSCCPSRM